MRKCLSIKNAKYVFVVIIIACLICVVSNYSAVYIFILHFVPINYLGRQLYSPDPTFVRESLAIMRYKGASNEIERAIILLTSEDDYVWLGAARYLGRNGVTNAVPYLIKSLRHTASRGDEETLIYLQNMTGEYHGTEFNSWYVWWARNNRTDCMDWDSHLGPRPRLRVDTNGGIEGDDNSK